MKNDARLTVDKFCAWMLRHPRYSRGTNHDVAVMLTRNAIGPAGMNVKCVYNTINKLVLFTEISNITG